MNQTNLSAPRIVERRLLTSTIVTLEHPIQAQQEGEGTLMKRTSIEWKWCSSILNQNMRPHLMGLRHSRTMALINTHTGYMCRLYPYKLYGQYGNSYRLGLRHGSIFYDPRTNGRFLMAVDSKCKLRLRANGLLGYGNERVDGLDELNRGPRAKMSKNENGFAPVPLVSKEQNIPLAGTIDYDNEQLRCLLVSSTTNQLSLKLKLMQIFLSLSHTVRMMCIRASCTMLGLVFLCLC